MIPKHLSVYRAPFFLFSAGARPGIPVSAEAPHYVSRLIFLWVSVRDLRPLPERYTEHSGISDADMCKCMLRHAQAQS